MPKTIYDKAVRYLLHDMVAAFELKPGQVFTATKAVDWFKKHYPKLSSTGIRADLKKASTNDKNRLHYGNLKPEDDLLFQVDTGQYRLYEAGKDPAPIRELVPGDVEREQQRQVEAEAEEAEASADATAVAGATEFLLEKDLQNFLARHLDRIEPGLRLYEDSDGTRGIEYDAGGRRIDILALDSDNALVVLELKVSKGYDRVVGQLLRYVNWVRQNLAEQGQRVRGMIVCRAMTDDLKLACSSVPDIELFEYQLSVTVTKVHARS